MSEAKVEITRTEMFKALKGFPHCRHFGSLHTPDVPVTPPRPQPSNFNTRWFGRLQNAQGKRLVSAPQPSISGAEAHTKALRGFRATPPFTRAVSTPPPQSKAVGKRKLSDLEGPKRTRFKADEPHRIQGIYVVPDAFDLLKKRTNNSGVSVLEIECPTPSEADKTQIVALGYGRITTEDDAVTLDPNQDA
ncbi:hypothetical protein FRC07_013940, partial [Ceratobasidium sp. 392]